MRASAEAGLTVNLRTASRTTCNVTVLLTPSDVALIVTLPGASPVTNPAASTLAIDGFSDVHLTATSVRGLPFEVRAMAVSFSAPPTTTLGYAGGSISTAVNFRVAHVHRGIASLSCDHRADRHHSRRVERDFAGLIRACQIERSGEPHRRFFVDGIARCIFGGRAELDLFSDVSVEGLGTDLHARGSH